MPTMISQKARWLLPVGFNTSDAGKNLYLLLAWDDELFEYDTDYAFLPFDKAKIIRKSESGERVDLVKDGIDYIFLTDSKYDTMDTLLNSTERKDVAYYYYFEALINAQNYIDVTGNDELVRFSIIHAFEYQGNPISYNDFKMLQPTWTHTLNESTLVYDIISSQVIESPSPLDNVPNMAEDTIRFCQLIKI